MNLEEILKNARPAVLVGQTAPNGNAATTNKTGVSNSGAGPAANAFNKINAGTVTTVKNPQTSIQYFGNGNIGVSALSGAGGSSKPKSGSGSGSGGTSSIVPDYKASLDDLYNKVMGYGNYTPGAAYTPTTFTHGVYTPSVYQRTVDTSGTEALLKQSLNDIHNYGDFKYDLNADMLYQQAIDNYMMKGQQAAADTTAMASALTGGYGNSYAALVGNQAYQDHITQANNMIPQFQQMALNIWQSGYDRLLNDYNATSQQLANLLDIEGMNFNIWNANESNAANAFGMNEANRYNAWAQNEQNAINAWQQNEQNAYNQWLAGYNQLNDQYELAKDYYATLEALQKASGGSGGSSSSGNKANATIPAIPKVSTATGTSDAAQKAIEEYFKKISNVLK